MSTIYDYLKWRGDLPFELFPLNLVDNLIFSILSYMDYHKEDEGKTLKELGENAKEKGYYISSVEAFFPTKIITEVGNARRFSDVTLTCYENIYDPIQDIQFAAMHFKMKDCTYISFRGTDITITGWKEDFMMSFRKTNAQELAVKYLLDTMKDEERYYIGGHSKGGNLAVFGAMMLPEERQNQIMRIYSNDGPGLSEEAIFEEGYQRIKKKICKILPSFSVVGKIYDLEPENALIIDSNAIGILQHDMCSWRVGPRGLKLSKGLNPTAEKIDMYLNRWIEGVNLEERTALVTDLFEALRSEGVEYVTDLTNPVKFDMVILHLVQMPRSSKKVAFKLPELVINDIREDSTGFFRMRKRKIKNRHGRKKEVDKLPEE